MSNNKILTVSYGTFSCTLEGFDDSFGTMKAIAEYFRGLSSDAPYFGAEPPQPDADMLARIAQREISRRVEAREHEGKIHLSAKEDPKADEAQTPRALSGDVAKPAALAAAALVSAQETQTQPAQQAAEFVAPDVSDEIADEVDAASEDAAEPSEAPQAVEAADHEDDTAPEPVLEDETEATFVEDENDIVPGQRDADVEAFFAKSTDVDVAGEEDEQDAPVAIEAKSVPQEDSIAAKLQRIRAVVAQQDDADEDDDYAEDQHADATDAPEAQKSALVEDARRDIEDALDADEAVDLIAEDEGDDDEDDIAAILSRLDTADGAEAALDADAIIPETAETSQVDDALNNLFGDDEDEDRAEISAERLMKMAEKAPSVKASESLPVQDTTVPASSEAAAPRARVIKVKRADLEAAIERGELEEYGDDAEASVPSLDDLAPAKSAASSLSAEDEAELARELADLEADMSLEHDDEDDLDDLASLDGNDDIDDASKVSAPQTKDRKKGDTVTRNALPKIDDAAGDDMTRLMAETDQQMDEPESTTRRDAFAHLRAAVAAKKADVAMGAPEKGEENDNAYRNDLADVVRPRRPVSGAGRTERPGDARPAPLKLVAEQRIDVERARPAGPVRPRRVAAVTEAVQTAPAGESFADYAAEMGATKLPQLLEAAASYMSFVEGREQFSRPQLMTKVRQVGPEEGFSREDGLRSFGQLLRAGKIEKIKGGRFTVSEDIGYQPDHRAAG
ncbi:MAG: hypothetical protein WA790_01040 [Sulfitobacter sp.]